MPRRSPLFVLLLLLLAAGCAADEEREPEIRDALGRPVFLDGEPQTLASLAPGVTEIIAAAGAFERLVAVTTADDFPPGVDTLTRISALPVDFEALALADPDLVIGTTQVNNPADAETLTSIGIPVYFLSNRSVEEILTSISDIGDLLGLSREAERTVDSLQAQIAELRRRTEPVTDPPSVIVLIAAETPYSFGPESYVHDLVRWAGGQSITENFPTEAPVLTDEFVLDAQPEVIVGTFGEDFRIDDLLEHHPTWRNTPAVREGRVYSVPADELLRAGPRVVQAAWTLGRVLHPGLVGDAP